MLNIVIGAMSYSKTYSIQYYLRLESKAGMNISSFPVLAIGDQLLSGKQLMPESLRVHIQTLIANRADQSEQGIRKGFLDHRMRIAGIVFVLLVIVVYRETRKHREKF